MIDVEAFPVITGNMSALRGHAMMIAVAGTGYIDTGARVHTTWQTLRPHYTAPETGQLLAATGPVAAVSRQVGENLQQASDALTVYADTVETIQGELDALRARAGDVNASITAAGDDWRSDHDLVGRHNGVVDAVAAQAVAFEEAQRVCANALRALHGQAPLAADDGDGIIDPATEFGYSLDQYRAVAAQGDGLPWGATADPDHPWYVDVVTAPGRFAAGLGDAVVNTAIGLGALVGYDHATGGWTGATAGAAWTNVGKLALAVTTYASPSGALHDRLGNMPFLEPGEAGQILTDTGKALIAYDQWDDDPARAAGTAVGNIALAVVGTKGAGAGLRGVGAALQLSRAGTVTARTGAVVTRAGEAIGRIPTLTEVAGNTWRRLHPPHTPTPALPDTPPTPGLRGTGGGPGTLADDVGPRPTSDARPAAPEPGPGARPEPAARSADAGQPRPDTDDAAPRATAAADDPPARRIQEDSTIVGTTASHRDLVTAGARPPVGHANGADPVPRRPDADGPSPSRPDGDDGSPAPADTDRNVTPVVHDTDGGAIPGDRAPDSADGPAADVDDVATAHGTDPADGSSGRNAAVDVTLHTDSDLPVVAPGHGVLGAIDESRLTRDSSGLISQVDGVPLAEHLTDLSHHRAASFREARAAGAVTVAEVGKVTSSAIDTRTGLLAEGTNGLRSSALQLDELHPLLAERYRQAHAAPEFPATSRDGTAGPEPRPFPAPYDPLGHAEVKAVNELLWRRGADAPPQALTEIRVENYFPFRGDGVKSAPCCASCAMMLADVKSGVGRFTGFPPGPHNFVNE